MELLPNMKARYLMAVLASICMGLIYGLKVALHVVIVAMVNSTAIMQESSDSNRISISHCQFEESVNFTIKPEDGSFVWNNEIQGWLLSSYFFAYLIALIPGGRIAELVSAKWVLFFSVAINVLAHLLSPISAKIHHWALLVMRILQGIGGGVTFPACHVMLSKWAPPNERSVMSSVVYAGTALGTVIFILVSGVIAGALGWEAVFYIEGGASAIWLILWAWLIEDTPTKQKYISEDERKFIVSSLEAEDGGKSDVKASIPWKSVLTSLPFWAILIAHTCSNWGWYLLLIELPQYMKNVLKFEISKNAVLSALPFFTLWVFSVILGKVLDILRGKGLITTTSARKIATFIASFIPLICFISLSFIECQRVAAVVLMTIAVTAMAGMFCGFLSNHIDIAPNFAGTLMALTNTVASIPGIVVPIAVGNLTHADPTINAWRTIFYITVGMYIIEILVYMIFGSGNVQSWNNQKKSGEEQPLRDSKH